MSKRIVIALGGNALGSNLEEQMKAVKNTAVAIADLIEEGNEIVIAHGNGPQVGMIQNAMTELRRSNPEKYVQSPLSVCVAMSQGYIGYDLQNAIRAELLRRGIYRPVSTVLTQVTVDPYDDSFYTPSKAIGRLLTEEEAECEEHKGNYVTKVEGGYRRIVAAPKPQEIIEIDAIRTLIDADQIVIAAGGGGIPVLVQAEELKGASAVIEKDLISAKLAEMIHADELMILTSVEHVSIGYNTSNAEPLSNITVADARKYMAQGQFEPGSMLPKIEASVEFLEKGGKRAVITSIDKAKEGYLGKTGTIIQ